VERYDVIFDAVGKSSFVFSRPHLVFAGAVVTVA
jgi:hypothetical protein